MNVGGGAGHRTSGAAGDGDPRLSPLNERHVHLPRVADVVADRIRELIISGEIRDGERLPRLETLIEQFGVSAPSMREALRILEAEGLISVKRGNVGGAVVQRPNAKTAAYNLALVLGSRGTHVGDVADALAELEPLCAMFCARRADRNERVVPDLRRLNVATREAVDQGDEMRFNDVASEFHATLVRGTGNATLTLTVGALQSVWLTDMRKWVVSAIAHGTYFTSERIESLEYHERLTEAVAAGDEEQAYQLMRRHINTRGVYGSEADAQRRVDPRAVRYGSRAPDTSLIRPAG